MTKVIAIVGPTGVGKTKLSIALAKALDGEVINADSVQIYRGMDIGSAKVTSGEMDGVVHHLLDIKDPHEKYSVYDYQCDGRKKIAGILNRGKTPIIVGGTGLYIKALLYDYRFNQEHNVGDEEYKKYSNDELYKKLKAVDPTSSEKIHKNNRKRVIRALKYYDLHQEPISNNNNADQPLYDALFIGLTTNRDNLYQRINDRVDEMIDNGLLNEVKGLYDQGLRGKNAMTAIGYKELCEYYAGEISLDEAVEKIKRNSRRYAKRQYTWFKNQMDVAWFETDFNNFDKTISEVLNYTQ